MQRCTARPVGALAIGALGAAALLGGQAALAQTAPQTTPPATGGAPAATAPEAGPRPPAAPAAGSSPAGPGLLARTWATATDMDAWKGPGLWRVAFAPAAPHFRYSEEHRHVWALAVERQRPDDWLAGFSFFRNSFGQPSAYAYVGKRFNRLWGVEPLFFQASAGVLYGYKGKFKDKVALNVGGFAPGALVGVGWKFNDQASATVHLLGDAALMFQFAWDFK